MVFVDGDNGFVICCLVWFACLLVTWFDFVGFDIFCFCLVVIGWVTTGGFLISVALVVYVACLIGLLC